MLNLPNLFQDHPTASWAAISSVLSIIAAFVIRFRRIGASLERTRIRTAADVLAAEVVERASFRATLMAEINVVRAMMKECESEREAQRVRLNTAEGQILILKASNEIMEKWVAFFRDRNSAQALAVAGRTSE